MQIRCDTFWVLARLARAITQVSTFLEAGGQAAITVSVNPWIATAPWMEVGKEKMVDGGTD